MTRMLPIFRERLEQAMREDGRTRAEIAKHSGYSAAYLRRLVKGDRRSPTIEMVEIIAQTLRVPPAWLLGLSEDRW